MRAPERILQLCFFFSRLSKLNFSFLFSPASLPGFSFHTDLDNSTVKSMMSSLSAFNIHFFPPLSPQLIHHIKSKIHLQALKTPPFKIAFRMLLVCVPTFCRGMPQYEDILRWQALYVMPRQDLPFQLRLANLFFKNKSHFYMCIT